MPAPNVNITLLDGGLARPAAGRDHISGLLFYGASEDSLALVDIAPRAFTSYAQAETFSLSAPSNEIEAQALFHIAEFFRMAPGSTLWYAQKIDATATPAELNAQLVAMQSAAGGDIRQFGVCGNGVGDANATTHAAIETTAAAVGTQMETFLEENRPAVCILPNPYAVDGSRAPVATTLSATKRFVGYVVARDGNSSTNPNNYMAVGTLLGSLAKLRVSQDPGAHASNPISDGSRFNTIEIGSTPHLFTAFSQTELDVLHDAGLIYISAFVGETGAWFASGRTLAPATSDYAYLGECRVMHKAVRVLYGTYLQEVNENNITVNADGTISTEAANYYEALGKAALKTALLPADATAVNVVVDPTQKPISSGILNVAAVVQPRGTSRTINITLGYTISI